MKTATIHQTKTHLSRLLKEVQAGETIVILNGSTPVAQADRARPPRDTTPESGNAHLPAGTVLQRRLPPAQR